MSDQHTTPESAERFAFLLEEIADRIAKGAPIGLNIQVWPFSGVTMRVSGGLPVLREWANLLGLPEPTPGQTYEDEGKTWTDWRSRADGMHLCGHVAEPTPAEVAEAVLSS